MILVAGGTGRLGSRVANRLSRRGLQVRTLGRGSVAPDALDPEIEVVVGDVRDPASVRRAVSGAATVVSAVQGFVGAGGVTPANVDRDGNAHLVDAAEREGCDVVLVSVLRAAPDGPMELVRMKYAAEQRLLASACPWTVVRPEAFAQTWIEIMRDTAGRSRRPLVFGDGVNQIAWVDVEDVAALVDRAVVDTTLRGRVLEIAGPESLGLLDLARAVMAHEGWSGSPRRVPRGMLRLAAATVGRVRPASGRQVRAALAMDTLPPVDTTATPAEFPDLPCSAVSTVIERAPRSAAVS
jgi:uncharacterized protein YbjT (DUF2867 family)